MQPKQKSKINFLGAFFVNFLKLQLAVRVNRVDEVPMKNNTVTHQKQTVASDCSWSNGVGRKNFPTNNLKSTQNLYSACSNIDSELSHRNPISQARL
jgi:hypothetical protein